MKTPIINSLSDYSSFAMMNGNRPLNKNKIEKIKTDVQAGFNLLPFCPVIVFEKDGKYFIVDGQHRFEVSKELSMPIYYVITEELSLFQVATMNSKQEKWKEKDFLNCYIELGVSDYQLLHDLCEEFHIGIKIVAELLLFGTYLNRPGVMDQFREGNFQAKYENKAREMLKLVTTLFDRYKFYSDRNLYHAIQLIRDKGLCDFDFLQEKIKQAPMVMDKQTTYKEYIYNIEKVYNHKASNRKVII